MTLDAPIPEPAVVAVLALNPFGCPVLASDGDCAACRDRARESLAAALPYLDPARLPAPPEPAPPLREDIEQIAISTFARLAGYSLRERLRSAIAAVHPLLIADALQEARNR